MSGSDPLVTIVIPCYNGERFVGRCLSSLARQTYRALEVLLVDDASTDRTAEEVSKYPFVRVLRNEVNKGVSYARNRGIKEARGKYIHFLDVDDEVSSNFYEAMVRRAEQTGADVTVCSFVFQRVPLKSQFYKYARTYSEMMDKMRITYVCKVGVVWRYLIRRDFILEHDDLSFPIGRVVEDLPFTVRMLYYANKVTTAPRAEYLYHYEPTSLTESWEPEARKAFAEGLEWSDADLKAFLRSKGITRMPGRNSHMIGYALNKVRNYIRGRQTDLTERLRR